MACLVMMLMGCANGLFGEKEEEVDPYENPPESSEVTEERALEVGETVTFEYRSDGVWHQSPYLAFEGHQLVVQPHGNSRAVNSQALRFRINEIPQLMNHDQPFTVTNPGRFYFTVNRKFLAEDFYSTIMVEITRVK